MKHLLLGMAAAAAMIAPAQAADMRAPVMKAPIAAPVASWTGCHIGGGFGYGMWNQETDTVISGVAVYGGPTSGGRGWFGTVGGGCDLQVSSNWVLGVFADYDFADLKGSMDHVLVSYSGSEKERSAWAVGGRIGYLITPTVLTYFSAGFTEARFSAVNLSVPTIPASAPAYTVPGHTYSGWFLGSGYEYNLGWLPGLFWRTEYRYARYDRDTVPVFAYGTNTRESFDVNSEKFVQTIRSELVWRWNWGR